MSNNKLYALVWSLVAVATVVFILKVPGCVVEQTRLDNTSYNDAFNECVRSGGTFMGKYQCVRCGDVRPDKP
ncbi:MAG: hypothetical protein KGL39_24740 [Patescibacteria group bacterium]|nr:hypothetical protein [Patescibacteria group bacterium]